MIHSISAFMVVSLFYFNVLVINFLKSGKYKAIISLFISMLGVFVSFKFLYQLSFHLQSDYKLSVYGFAFLSIVLIVIGIIGFFRFLIKGSNQFINFQNKVYSQSKKNN